MSRRSNSPQKTDFAFSTLKVYLGLTIATGPSLQLQWLSAKRSVGQTAGGGGQSQLSAVADNRICACITCTYSIQIVTRTNGSLPRVPPRRLLWQHPVAWKIPKSADNYGSLKRVNSSLVAVVREWLPALMKNCIIWGTLKNPLCVDWVCSILSKHFIYRQ